MSEKIINDYVIAFEIINIFLKPVFGIIYDKFKFKLTMLIFNILTAILILSTYLSLTKSNSFGILTGFNSLMLGGFGIIFNTAAIDIFGIHGF